MPRVTNNVNYRREQNRRNVGGYISSQNMNPRQMEQEIVHRQTIRNDDDLIIDGNAVYEIDSDCYEKSKKSKLAERQNGRR